LTSGDKINNEIYKMDHILDYCTTVGRILEKLLFIDDELKSM